MNTKRAKTVKKQGFEELSEFSSFVTGTGEGAALSFRNCVIIDITAFLSSVFKTVARAQRLRQGKVDGFGQFNNKKYIANWWVPKNDVLDRLDKAKYEVQKQIGYF